MLSEKPYQDNSNKFTKNTTMKYTENAINIFTVKTYKGIGKAWIVKNLKGNESIETIVALLNNNSKQEVITVADFEKNKNQLKERLKKLEGFCDGFVALGDEEFPEYRGNVKSSEQPVFLYYKGDINLLKKTNKNISVIGLLNPDSKIEEKEQELVAEFIKNGATIVSGLAFGCDSISHRQALASDGKTVAILPSPLNNILPAKNKDLAGEIVQKEGLLVTEYGNDFKTTMELSSRYKERDRLQALFCDAIILAASYAPDSIKRWNIQTDKKLDSGARLAMAYARDYNIPRAVMYDPSDDDNPMFDLNRQLIKEQADITIINQDNLTETVKKMILKKPDSKHNTVYQTSLFGF
jgi:DNA processing protein